MPIVARDLLHGGAQTYGVMLGAFGMGAVIGALNISKLRGRPGDEVSIRLCMIVMGVCVVLVAISRLPVLSGSALVFAGAGWTGPEIARGQGARGFRDDRRSARLGRTCSR